ncbi:Tyrosine-protein kinase [Parasponia andersonii]|uniref:Tyrosine-protein kinase n=1 Tax=Parasponia andersonii TaxID=3476 RepID=A0A2P5CXS4_PARAD|nr:Tyrosine-protein kinase [Parasponia andersonii]
MRKVFSSCVRCFAKDPSFQLSEKKCNIISVNDEGEAIFHHRSSSSSSESAASSSSAVNRPKPLPKSFHLKLMKGTKPNFGKAALNACCTALPDMSDSSSQSSDQLITSFNEKIKMVAEPPRDQGMISSTTAASGSTHPQLVYPFGISSRKVCDPNFVLGLPLKLTKQVIEEITLGFSKKVSSDEDQQFVVYDGFFAVSRSRVLVKMFRGESGGVFLSAEMKAAFSMRHKNILRLIGYHQSDNTTFLVFPFAERGTLDSNLNGLRGEEFNLTFQDKFRIAIGIAQGLRYMHEECPRGPVVHGKLSLSNVFIGDDLQPQISGFGRATWLHLKQSWPIFIERCCLLEDHLNHDLMAQVKLDVLSFGVLLLRLFCRRSVPQDDDTLIKWARPLLLERAFHILLHEDEEDLDMHEMFRVMCTAFQCAMTRPDNRPYMSEVKQ